MKSPRISASSYSNTAPLVWSFLYGRERGNVELILDTAPARSAELLAGDRVDAALVPVIAYQSIDEVRVVPDICVGAKRNVRSVCLVTRGIDLDQVKSVSLDVSSRTSVTLTKVIFREFLGYDPIWMDSLPNIDEMLEKSDCALLIGDPALTIDETSLRKFDLAELWNSFTGFGFVFAMWMTRRDAVAIDLVAARNEGLENLTSIAANYASTIGLSSEEMYSYLSDNISYSIDENMQSGLELYFDLAFKNNLIPERRELRFV